MSQLEKCTGCARHVRIDEATCPFCRIELPASFRQPRMRRPSVAGRVGRIALIAAGAAAAGVATTACGNDDTNDVVLYGGPAPSDGGADATAKGDADAATVMAVAAYGTVVGIAFDGGDDDDASLGDGGGDASHEDASFDGGDSGDGGDADASP